MWEHLSPSFVTALSVDAPLWSALISTFPSCPAVRRLTITLGHTSRLLADDAPSAPLFPSMRTLAINADLGDWSQEHLFSPLTPKDLRSLLQHLHGIDELIMECVKLQGDRAYLQTVVDKLALSQHACKCPCAAIASVSEQGAVRSPTLLPGQVQICFAESFTDNYVLMRPRYCRNTHKDT